MRINLAILSIITIIAAPLLVFTANGSSPAPKMPDISLTDFDGKRLSLRGLKDNRAVVVVFLSFECPVSTSYMNTLNELATKYRAKNVTLLGICPSLEKATVLAKQAAEYQLQFPILHDPELKAAKAFGAKVVPEAILLDSNFAVHYRGRIDDTYYARLKRRNVTKRHDLKIALEELLGGKAVSVPATEAVGCPIQFERPRVVSDKVTFHRDVLPILQRRCQSCHRPGAVGPFSLMTYRHAINWANDIKSYTQSRQMPPWMPAAGLPFRDERKMTATEIATVAAWVDNGMPKGDSRDAPAPVQYAGGWKLGEPDLVLEMADKITVAPDGRDLFRCFVFPTNLKEDKFVTAFEVRPSNPAAVHHTVHFLDTQGRGRRLQERFQKRQKKGDRDYGPGYNFMMGPGFFPPSGDAGGWAPGISPHRFHNVGYYLPKGADFVVQIHYHRTGRVENDKTKIGLYFSKSKDCQPLQTIVIGGRFLMIPAGKSNHRVQGDMWAAQDCTLYTIIPHMHLVGKSIKVTMTPPGGKPVTLIGIDKWDYNWQEIYHFQKPIRVKAGTHFHVDAVYDNSSGNPNNPFNPPRNVFAGEQTTNEMCFAFLGVTTDDGRAAGMRLWRGGPVVRRLGALPPRTEAADGE